MSHVFNLNDSGDQEDYLDFDFPGDSEPRPSPPPASRARKSTAAPKGRPSSKSRVSRQSYDDMPIHESAYDHAMPEEITSSSSSKKIPLKQVQDHQNIILQLNSYAASKQFKPVLDESGIKLKDLTSKSLAELKELRERVRATCANSGGGAGLVANMALGICGGMEAMAPKIYMDLEGYRLAVDSNPEFHALAEMIELDSGFRATMTPIQRMAVCLGTTALTVSKENAAKNKLKNEQEKLVESLIAQRNQMQVRQAPAASAAANNIVSPSVAPPAASNVPPKITSSMYD